MSSHPLQSYMTWDYAPGLSGEVSFAAPVKPGDYEVRVFPYSYINCGKSDAVTVEGMWLSLLFRWCTRSLLQQAAIP